MKSGNIAVSLAAVVVFLGIAQAFLSNKGAVATAQETPLAKAETKDSRAAAVQVDDLADSPEKFKGEIYLKAAVARVSKGKGLFSVIDAREFESCGEVTCAKHYLPVKFTGELPKPETVIFITGEVVKTEKGLMFEAKRVDTKK